MGGVIIAISVVVLVYVLYGYCVNGRIGWVPWGWSGHGQGADVLTARSRSGEIAVEDKGGIANCSCPDFMGSRASYRVDDPRRLCRHLVRRIYESATFPEFFTPYKEELDECAGRARGFYPYAQRGGTIIQGKRLVMFAEEYDENPEIYEMLIFFDGKRFMYRPEIGKWGNDAAPEYAVEIENWARDMILRFQPEPLPEGSIRTLYRDEGRTAYHLRGEIVAWGRSSNIQGSMKHGTDIFLVSCGPADNQFCSLEYHVLTGECIVSQRLRYMERAIRRWLEEEYPNQREDWLWGGF